MRIGIRALVGVMVLFMSAQNGFAQQDTAQINELKRQMDALSREIEALRLGEDVVARADTSTLGFGPAASKVYRTREGVSVGGYGEIVYQNFANTRENDSPRPASTRDNIDALRVITYLGYKFSPRFVFNSEVEFEHANTEAGGEVEVEFAYLDYVASPAFGLRGGLLLVPMGFLNELHEPPIYLGTTRPLTESAVLPTTWSENGVGVYGDVGSFSYRAYLVAGFDATGISGRAGGFSASGLRGGRQKGARSLIENPGFVVRADFTPGAVRGLLIGASLYTGKSGQGATLGTGEEIDAGTTIAEGHAQFKAHGFDLRGLFATASVDDADLINAAKDLTGANSVPEELGGWYVQAGYDVLRGSNQMQLTPYVRYESLNTQREVPSGFSAQPANERTVALIGAQFKPLSNIVVKADYQIHSNEASTGLNQFNIVLGYLF